MELIAAAPDILDQLIAQLEAVPATDQERMYWHMKEASKLLRQYNERSRALAEGRIFPGDES